MRLAGRHAITVLALMLLAAASATALEQPEPTVPGELHAKASAEGTVRVLVQLRLPAVPADARVQAIEVVQHAVRQEIAPTRHRVMRTYDTVPLLALEASSDTLRVLASSPHVLRVEEDGLATPQ